MVISQPPGNNPSYYYRASPTLPIHLNASRDTLCSIHAITTSGNPEMVLLRSYNESDPRRDHCADFVSLFILSLHALALHLAVKTLSKSSV